MNSGFIKIERDNNRIFELIRVRPTAYTLLSIIALRAKRTDEPNFQGLQIGEAFIGDYETYGVTEQIYRTDKEYLKKFNFATFRTTNRGTIACLCNNSGFDINPTNKLTTSLTPNQRPTNDQPTTNKNDKNDKNEKKENIVPVETGTSLSNWKPEYGEKYIQAFNRLFDSKYILTPARVTKLKLRFKTYTSEQMGRALLNLSESKFHRGDNDRGWRADPDFLIRSDEMVDKWLNKGGENV